MTRWLIRRGLLAALAVVEWHHRRELLALQLRALGAEPAHWWETTDDLRGRVLVAAIWGA